MSDDILYAHGSDKPTPNFIGRTFRLKHAYTGHDEVPRYEATVTEMIGRNALGVPLYGCTLKGYVNPFRPEEQITVDFAANEFDWEQGEAYQEQADRGFKWLTDVCDGDQ